MLAVLRSRAVAAPLSSPTPHRWRQLGFLRSLSSSSSSHKPTFLELEEVEKILGDVKADDVRVIPVGDQCDWTDYMVIATGRSNWHVRNIAQALIHKIKQKQKGSERLLLPSVEGHGGGNWIVIDSGNVIVHALEEKARAYYNLESLWMTEMTPKGPNLDLENALGKTRPRNNSKKLMKSIQ
ncbi:protein Iojap-related, mitochondrial [Canna indica]|uniref:Protein Iojap-related, mitochondrial n=1 Tax=Canna indica TaxID=4628 RepID=A0AAQ3K960_9LILI|nr:protein Iojap-related, mitochondrial [Canna indica]